MSGPDQEHVPVTVEHWQHVNGPVLPRAPRRVAVGDDLVPDRGSDHQQGRTYVAEPSGPFEDDPNVTDTRFPGPNPTYRSRPPLRVVGEVLDWT